MDPGSFLEESWGSQENRARDARRPQVRVVRERDRELVSFGWGCKAATMDDGVERMGYGLRGWAERERGLKQGRYKNKTQGFGLEAKSSVGKVGQLSSIYSAPDSHKSYASHAVLVLSGMVIVWWCV
jgi:hypothetical protein